MEAVGPLLNGFATILQPQYLFAAFVGVFLGTAIGVLPGIGPVVGISLLLPFTFDLDTTTTLIMLAGIYYGTQYGGSTTSILVNVPGESSSVITAIDGHQMARQGRAGPALSIAAIGSFVAGTVSVIFLMLLAPLLVPVALSFGPKEDFALMVLGLSMASLLSSGSVRKGLIAALLGLLIAMIGLDPVTGQPRFTLETAELAGGIEIVALVVGLFGISEVLANVSRLKSGDSEPLEVGRLWPSRDDMRRAAPAIGRGTLSGFAVGLLPGGGGIVSSLVSYAVEKLVAKDRGHFGKGAIEGVAGPESANNAASTATFVPLLTLGLPSNPIMALILTALVIQGVQPGPRFLAENPDLFWAFVASMYVGNVMLLILNLPLVGLWTSMLRIPERLLLPMVVGLCFIGVYSVNASLFDLGVMLVAGIVGYAMRQGGFPIAPLVLSFVLARRLELSFGQSMLISQGDPRIFVSGAIAPAMLAAAALIVLVGLVQPTLAARRARNDANAATPAS